MVMRGLGLSLREVLACHGVSGVCASVVLRLMKDQAAVEGSRFNVTGELYDTAVWAKQLRPVLPEELGKGLSIKIKLMDEDVAQGNHVREL